MTLTLVELIQQEVEVQLSNIHTNMPAKIVSYDAVNNRAVVQPILPKALASGDSLDPPQIVEVPIVFPASGNGKASLTFPLQPNDGVALSIQQRSIDGWLDSNHNMPDDPRQFDLSDAIAHPGCQAKNIVGDPNNVVLKFDKATVTLNNDNSLVVGNDKGSIAIAANGSMNFVGGNNNNASISIDAYGNMTINAQSIRINTPTRSFYLEQHRHDSTQPAAIQNKSGLPL